MGAIFSRVKTWSATEDVTASDLNAEFDNILDNLTAANVDDYSATVGQMQTTTDPGEVGTESQATSVAGEIERLRFLIAEITGKDEWYESPVSSIAGLANAIGSGLTDNRLVSGKVASTSAQPLFLSAVGTAATATLNGSTTNFIYYIEGSEYTISTDVTLTGLTAAPASNNTCLIDDANAADDEYTKYTGENGTVITVDNMGSEISSLVGEWAAFSLAGVGTEYFIAYVESTTRLSKAFRGFFFDSSDAAVARTAYTNNDTITLLKLAWIFAKDDGTLTVTYTNPVWSDDEPSSPSIGDYWFDYSANKWKTRGASSWGDADAILVGVTAQDTSNCIAARSFEFFKNYSDLNTCELEYVSATEVHAKEPGSQVSVWGATVKNDWNKHIWDITADRDTGVSESASTTYYIYLTETGDTIISDIRPFDRREDLKGYYHPHKSWRCLGSFVNDGSSNIDSNSVNSYFSREGAEPLREASAALHIEVSDKVIYLSGASASEYLPPAAKTKGQTFKIFHKGTSLSQVYTLTTFGAEVFSSSGTTTMAMATQGEMFRLYSDGVGYQVMDHYSETKWVDAGALSLSATSSAPTIGTTSTNSTWWKRRGQDMFYKVQVVMTAAGTAGSGDYLFSIPSGAAINTTVVATHTAGVVLVDTPTAQNSKLHSSITLNNVISGTTHFYVSAAAYVYSTTQFRISGRYDGSTNSNVDNTHIAVGGAGFTSGGYAIDVIIPISGWEP